MRGLGAANRRLGALAVLAVLWAGAGTTTPPPPVREEAYRANNRGVALLEQFRHEQAAEAFRQALKLDPGLAIARVNLAIALLNVPDPAGAEKEARAAAALLPEAPQPHYILGLVARGQNRPEEAEAAFRKVLVLDPADVGTNVNLGQIFLQRRRYAEAIASFRAALEAELFNATAVYNLGLALIRSAQAQEGQRMMERFRALREGGYGTLIGAAYSEQGRYAEALVSTGSEPELVDLETPAVRFVDATASMVPEREGRSSGAAAGEPDRVTLLDVDGDSDLDLYQVGPGGQRLRLSDGGALRDVTARFGLAPERGGVGAVAGDYDNDSRPDLLVLRPGGPTLHRNEEGRGFVDVTAAAGIPSDPPLSRAAAFLDADHDGDLDVFLPAFAEAKAPGGAAHRLLQNSGSGTFKDVAPAAGLAEGPSGTVAVVATDFDNRRDVDLLVLPEGGPPILFRNMRDGTFRDVAAEVSLAPPSFQARCVAAADVDKDDFTDFFLCATEGPDLLALSDGRGRFRTVPAPEGSSGSRAAQFLDYDNDGLLDLLVLSPRGLRLLRNVGKGWADVTGAALPEGGSPGEASLAAADLDGDGDTDLVFGLPGGALRVLRNEGGSRNRSLRVRLSGLVSNRSAVGAKVEMRAGSLRQKLETYAATPPPAPADVLFGLGRRDGADAVRVLWPAGILQTELVEREAAKPGVAVAVLEVKELDRKPSSCPYLFAWNGERFEFATDFMGGGEMGYLTAPGVFNVPDPDEHVRLREDQLRPRRGRYEVRVTNELEEALFVDRLELMAVAHPADVEVLPNEGLVSPPRPPFRLHAARDLRPPASALDDHGHDVLDRVARLDRRCPDDFRLHRIRGYAEQHALVLDLGPEAGEDALLLLTGWTDYAFSSDNRAAHQAGLGMRPPALEVEDAAGSWRTVVPEIGIPVGRPQTLVVELAGRWLGPSRRVRVVTNMRIYWDQVLVATAAREVHPRIVSVPLAAAELKERGFSAEVSPDRREPFSYDYDRVSWASPWKLVPGRYTRVGDVRELLLSTDDMFVISRPGDEIALSFDATALPPLPPGWRRTFLFYADGFSKEMDINSATPDSLGPLPFHGMSRYPYEPPEAYPLTPERQAYLERYNTRLVTRLVPTLDLALLTAGAAP